MRVRHQLCFDEETLRNCFHQFPRRSRRRRMMELVFIEGMAVEAAGAKIGISDYYKALDIFVAGLVKMQYLIKKATR
jgi:hypothetical protein